MFAVPQATGAPATFILLLLVYNLCYMPTLGLAIDAAGWTEIIGTIAGDDAVLIITKSERARRAVQTRIKELAGIPD